MRTKTFRPCDQHSLLLMPPSLHDWVDPAGLPAFVSDLVDELQPPGPGGAGRVDARRRGPQPGQAVRERPGRPGAPGLDPDNGAGDPMGHRVTSRTTPRLVVRARFGHPASRTPAVRAFRASPLAIRSTSTAITDPGS